MTVAQARRRAIMARVPMRFDCKHYESRTYASGEVVRMCRLDLAPDAPWRCPDDCPSFARRIHDAGWTVGTLGTRPEPPEPELVGEGAAELLDQAERIINTAGPSILADVQKRRTDRRRGDIPWWRRRFPRRR